MSRGWSSFIGRFIILSGLVFLTAGCNNSGMVGPDSGVGAVASIGGGAGSEGAGAGDLMATFASIDENGGDWMGGDDSAGFGAMMAMFSFDEGAGSGDGTEEIAKIHNPEPASMALMGLGLLGLLRRRKK